ncbi:MAG: hypothetical protein F4Y84_03305 [Caldilineaceae bacterium SB0665_bin_25]|nr:hypothetical protein [Caldilineaceae bacterium SB0665_bin_25]
MRTTRTARSAARRGTLQTDRTFTGQKEDGTGLLYYNARYYDPALGTFISPDSLVPDLGMVVDYNRFLYARGNPLKYSDSTGYIPLDLPDAPKGPPSGADPWVVDFYWKNRWYNARGFARGADGHWSRSIRPRYADKQILHEVIREDLLGWFVREIKGNTQDGRLKAIAYLNLIGKWTAGQPLFQFPAKADAYTMWASLVGPGRPWDYKGHIGEAMGGFWTYYEGVLYFYDVWANINCGYAGRAALFTHGELLVGAGQVGADLIRKQEVNYNWRSYFDDPADQAAVRIGIHLYDQHGLNIDEVKFRQVFQREAGNLRTSQEDEYRIP